MDNSLNGTGKERDFANDYASSADEHYKMLLSNMQK